MINEWDTATDRRLFLPAFRLAEIQFLQRRFDDSAATFGLAERRAESGHFITLDSARARLGRGAALVASERIEEGTAVLNGLDDDSAQAEAQFRLGQFVEQSDETAFYYAVVSYYTRLQLGDAERRTGRYRAAAEHYAAARERIPLTFYQEEVVPGVLDNNAALADLALGRTAEAQAASTRAFNEDPASPIFALTAASAAEQVGDTTRAMELNAAVLRSDPTAFPSANNLGVGLARQHQAGKAAAMLRQAVGARDDYALGWFNLGVLYSQRGPLFLLQSQGALSIALTLDPALVHRPRELVLDEHVYRTELDLSKPLPAGWSLGRVERRQPLAAVGLLGLLGITLGLSRLLAAGVDSRVKASLQHGAQTLRRFRLLERRRHVGWAIGATIIAFTLPTAIGGARADPTFLSAYVVLIALLTTLLIGVRQLLALRWKIRAIQRTWPPGLVVGVVSGAAGVPLGTPALRACTGTGSANPPGERHCHGGACCTAAARGCLAAGATHQGRGSGCADHDSVHAATAAPDGRGRAGQGGCICRGRHDCCGLVCGPWSALNPRSGRTRGALNSSPHGRAAAAVPEVGTRDCNAPVSRRGL